MNDLALQAVFVLALSLLGGVATYLQKTLAKQVKRGVASCLSDVLFSLLAGLGTWFLCIEKEFSIWLTLFCVLVAGLNGSDMLWAFKQKLHALIGTGKGNDNDTSK